MALIDTITAHLKGRGRKQIDVPEWGNGNGPLTIYWTPLTIEEQAKIYDATQKSSLAGLAKAVIIKAEDESGEKLFKPEDYPKLRKAADGKIVARVANAILDVPDAADLEKNLEAIRPY